MAHDAYIDHVTKQRDALVRANFWTSPPDVNPDAWLKNFDEQDRVIAATILQETVLFSGRVFDALLRRAFFRLLQSVAPQGSPQTDRQKAIEEFLTTAVFCPIEGEEPNVTDSGPAMCRRLRKATGLPQGRFKSTKDAVEEAARGAPVVFVDDFVGTGEQVDKTWKRAYLPANPKSFADTHAENAIDARVLATAMAQSGYERIQGMGLIPCVVHVLGPNESIEKLEPRAEHPIQDGLQAAIDAFLRKHAEVLKPKLKPYMQTGRHPSYGFGELGLTIGFPDSVPDSTLPIIWAPSAAGHWVPLKEQK